MTHEPAVKPEGGADEPLFSELVRQRHHAWWSELESGPHSRYDCASQLLTRQVPADHWRCCSLWQRKLSNKLNAKEFAASCGAAVAELYWSGKDPGDIPFDTLPAAYVVKTSLGWDSHQVTPVRDGRHLFDGRRCGPKRIVRDYRKLMGAEPFSFGEVMVEELLEGLAGQGVPKDYKFYVFGGHAAYITVMDRNSKRHAWYDRFWERTEDPIQLSNEPSDDEPPPAELDQLIDTAETLGRAYGDRFVRVDLYNTPKGIVFGEFTPTPFMGCRFTPFAEREFGRLWAGADCLPLLATHAG